MMAPARSYATAAQLPIPHKPVAPMPRALVQTKTRIGPVDDPLEREADRIADAVVADRPAGSIGGVSPGAAQRKCAECEAEEEKSVQRKCAGCAAEAHSDGGSSDMAADAVSHGGAPLTQDQRAYFEPRFDRDFSDVRIHADGRAAEAARAINARAYTAGRDIAFAAGQYQPRSQEGRRLLAHELTHVVHQSRGAPHVQRKEENTFKPVPSFPSSVTFRGCDDVKGRRNFVEQSTKNAFITARDCKGIKIESLKRDILASFEGLTVVCNPEAIAGRCAEAKKGESTIILSKLGLDGATGCPPLEEAIFHELVHLAEGWNLFHGNLSYDCGKACYPETEDPRGDASGCGNETGAAPFVSVSAGAAFTGKGAGTGYARVYAGVEKRGPILSFVRPSLGLGVSIIGDPESGAPGEASSGTGIIPSLIGALRIDPGKTGGLYFSLGGGAGVVFNRGDEHLGYEVGAKFGYRWSIYDVSFDAGINYDPNARDRRGEALYGGREFPDRAADTIGASAHENGRAACRHGTERLRPGRSSGRSSASVP